MSVGDAIAVLGLLERIGTEIRNYRHAPAQFQEFSVEIDFWCSTLRCVLRLNPEDVVDPSNLEKIRAIVMNCLRPLQDLANKMQVKEGVLGHFRTTRSVSAIGTRLHWSIIHKDVEEARSILISQMNTMLILLGIQQLSTGRHIFTEMRKHDNSVSKQINDYSNALIGQTSLILGAVSSTPHEIDDLPSKIISQTQQQSQQASIQSQGMATVTSRLEDLSSNVSKISTEAKKQASIVTEISGGLLNLLELVRELRLSRSLLDITNQMKRIIRAIEAIPLHLTVDIIRFDDALGVTWGLPFQACSTWESFESVLRNVVFANNREGVEYVKTNRYAILLPKERLRLDPWSWECRAKSGIHIEQAMLMFGAKTARQQCPGCQRPSPIVGYGDRLCSGCGLLATFGWSTILPTRDPQTQELRGPPKVFGPLPLPILPPMRVVKSRPFRRIHYYRFPKMKGTIEEALDILRNNEYDLAANFCAGLQYLQAAEHNSSKQDARNSIPCLETIVQLEAFRPVVWHLLARAYLYLDDYPKAHAAIQQAICQDENILAYWMTAAVLYYKVRQYHDSREAIIQAIRLDPDHWLPQFNFAILSDNVGEYEEAIACYTECLRIQPNVSAAIARLQVLVNHNSRDVPDYHQVHHMQDFNIPKFEQGFSKFVDEASPNPKEQKS
ncbi:uncharacterized protein F4822DRAFT_444337 [Hypoxylon trugodes]|uniref:uncharacterized protein n=1 Tax=Hypoxylon trugodes TaxID=326681 RepID=UPI00219558B8|nr:uncharacterized protein F4822DRAFT_444337 [Hypoxylon trugodes]KAI1387742.1 hypothetical protein F4822DRAFT_444337 [Hypoxylon trugodes]